jgi:uncharacterized membrane protein YccF (DUF307 family)
MSVRRRYGHWQDHGVGDGHVRTIGNLLWLLFSGIEMAVAYLIAGLLAILFIITIPLAVPSFRLAGYALWPFGRVVVRRPDAGAGSVVGNVLWVVVAGWWLALLHVGFGLLFAITIIGIPFTVAHLKLAGLALTPYGKDVVEARFADGHDVVLTAPRPLGSA